MYQLLCIHLFLIFTDEDVSNDFKGFLRTDIGGHVKDEVICKHVQQISHLLGLVKFPITDKALPLKLNELLTDKLKNTWQPLTVKTYLNSLLKYVNFLKTMSGMGLAKYVRIDLRQTEVIHSFILSYNKSMVKRAKVTQKAKQLDSAHDPKSVSPDDIVEYINSARASNAQNLLDNIDLQAAVSMQTHALVRNFIIVSMLICNPHRSGCIGNMTLDEFTKGKQRIVDGCHVIHVFDHKTRATYGPAQIALEKALYTHIECYVQYYRPASEVTHLFLNWGRCSNKMTK